MSDTIQQEIWGSREDLERFKLPKHSDQKEKIKVTSRQMRKMIYHCENEELKQEMTLLSDKTIEMFLYARKFIPAESFKLLTNYVSYRKRHPEIFEDLTLNANDIRKCLENGLPGILNHKDRQGRCVLVFTGSNWDCSYDVISIYRAFLFVLGYLLDHIYNQSNGFVVIVDWTGFTFRQTTYLKPSILSLMIEGLQDCYPARFMGIHFIGQSWYVETALNIIKPFFHRKVKDRIFMHGINLSTLHEHIHKEVLPSELGGENPSYDPRFFINCIMEHQRKGNHASHKS